MWGTGQWYARSDEHGRYADELQAVARDGMARKEAVDIVGGEEKRLRREIVFLGHLDEPLKEDRARALVLVALRGKLVRRETAVVGDLKRYVSAAPHTVQNGRASFSRWVKCTSWL